jgi:beta-lactamase regulating signal transducer with metallopeptidase domain
MNQLLYTPALTDRLIQALGWTLLHSLWQGLLVAIIAAAFLLTAKRSAAATRYNLVLATFILFTLSTITTLAWEWHASAAGHISTHHVTGISSKAAPLLSVYDFSGIQQFIYTCTAYFSKNAPLLVLVWFIFFVFRSVKLLNGLVYLQQARSRSLYAPPAIWESRLTALCKKLQLNKPVRFFESAYVKVPMVIGHLKPLILIPAGLLAGLPAEQIEAVLLHELAHIRRHDYLVNAMQAVMETVYFFNPGLLWISNLLRDERENCCDDIALAHTRNKKQFVQALISFKEHALYNTQPAVAFPGRKNQLLQRVSRILGNQYPSFAPAEKISFAAGTLIIGMVLATVAIGQVRSPKIQVQRNLTVALPVQSAPLPEINNPLIIKNTKRTVSRSARPVLKAGPTKNLYNKNDRGMPDEKPLAGTYQSQADKYREQARADNKQMLRDQQRAQLDQQQMLIDQQQSLRDQAQAIRQLESAKHDLTQSVKDQQQALKDQEQARIDQQQAYKDQQQALKDQAQAKIDQQQALKDQAQAAIDQKQFNKDLAIYTASKNIKP